MDERIKKKFEKIDTLIVLATENQIVNYLSLFLFDKKYIQSENFKIYSIINKDAIGKFNNYKLHNRFVNLFKNSVYKGKLQNITEKEENSILIEKGVIAVRVENLNSIDIFEPEIISELEKRKVLWNVTGGQRKLTIAVQKYISERRKETDLMAYFDGNENEFSIYDFETEAGMFTTKSNEKLVNLEEMLLSLGINTKKNIEDIKWSSNGYDKEIKDLEIIKKGCELVLKKLNEEDSEAFLNELLESNRLCNVYDNQVPKILEKYLGNEVEDYVRFLKNRHIEYLEKSKNKKSKVNEFGKIFEDIVFFGLIDLIEKDQEIKKKIVDVRKSYKVRDEKSKMIDELDIVITLKDGKLIVIECKTGSMTGDNAKSTNYTTYMLSGVYGMPLLIVPMIKGKIVLELKDKEDSYYYCVKSVKSAIRCNLEYYGIDKLKDILKTL